MRILLILSMFVSSAALAQVTELRQGMKIGTSVTIRKGLYPLNAPDRNPEVSLQSKAVIEISGENIVVDFGNAILQGSNDKQLPDEFYGVAVIVRNGRNITIKNLRARGFKVALMATGVEGLTIENCDLSYNYRQHLNSTQEKEDISDWMSFHQNEKDEWLRYGAAMYLRDCTKAKVFNNVVTGGQCALMMTRCENGLVYNNNFSFNSAIGIGMYRSSRNRILHNKLDWNVRGHSDGVYNRGQDSAGMLVFEQCHENVFAYNSATHSGDGFFLWAGQTTMDSGEGGCNDNVIYANDFSFAPTNGIEVTFSRNRISENIVEGCDHGIWGGYSFDTDIRRNIFRSNRIAIAVEHGQKNDIAGNTFTGNKESIRLWARKEQPKDWGYANKRDTRSRHYTISGNRFESEAIVYNIANTQAIKLHANSKSWCGQVYKLDSASWAALDSSGEQEGNNNVLRYTDITALKDGNDTRLPAKHPKGRKEMRITEWGPYDFRYPLLWRTNPVDTSGLLKFEVLGPKGRWKVVRTKGVEDLSKSSGVFPDSLSARKQKDYKGEILIELAFSDPELGRVADKPVTVFGKDIPSDQPFLFAFRDARVQMPWKASWFAVDSFSNPVKDSGLLGRLANGTPFMTRTVNDLNFAWWGGIPEGPEPGRKRYQQFLTVAESQVEVEPGEYELSVTWDDAVRVYFDGRLIIDEWNPSLYKFDSSPNQRIKLRLGGRHRLRVEHVELGGFATISVKLKKL